MIKFFLFFFIFTSAAFSCEIKTEPFIYYIKNSNLPLFKSSSCSKKLNISFNQLLFSLNGSVRSKDLRRIINSQSDTKIEKIFPQKITVISLKNYIQNNLDIPKSFVLSSLDSISKKNHFLLSRKSSFHVSCSHCKTLGRKNFKVTTTYKNDKINVSWLKGELVYETESLVPKVNLSVTNQPLNITSFEKKIVHLKSNQQPFTDLKKLKFFKLNQHILKGKPLFINQISPVNLIQAGHNVKLSILKKNILISSRAKALSRGSLNQIISLRYLKNNQIIRGKVIGYNKVVVE